MMRVRAVDIEYVPGPPRRRIPEAVKQTGSSSALRRRRAFLVNHVLALCRRVLRRSRERDIYVQQVLEQGTSLELAWRIDTALDWVWQSDDVEGKERQWEVLYGLALKQVFQESSLIL